MARDEFDPNDTPPTRSARRMPPPTDRLAPDDSDQVTASGNWRERGARRRRPSTFPASRQEFALWLQYGGWRVVTIAAAVVVLAILGMLLVGGLNRRPLARATPTAAPAALNQPIIQAQPSVTPVISPTASIVAQGAGVSSDGAKLLVTGTSGEGLFLRPNHDTNGEAIKTLPEGTSVTVIGDDFSGPDRVWKHIRDTDGTEGWAAADFLKPAP